ncbi:thioredoxin 1 [Grimontella sp. AG753]|nr:thioredoxin 1 [Grimontella sp. AG753]
MGVFNINNSSDFQKVVNTFNSQLIVVLFYAQWCIPSKSAYEKLDVMSNKYEGVFFMAINVSDSFGEIVSHKYNITSVPTFLFFKEGKVVAIYCGVNDAGVKSRIDRNI